MSNTIELLDPEPATLTVEARAAVALKTSETEKHLRALAAKNIDIVAILNKAGREQAHGAAMELKRARVDIEAAGKAARDDATKFSKAVITEEKRLVAIIEPEETRLLGLRDKWDDAQAAIKAEAERKERARIVAINERISELRGYVNLALGCRTAERVSALLEKLTANEITAELYQEFESEAAVVKESALARMGEILAQKKADEDERARVKAEQDAAAEALRKEREELDAAQAEAKRIAAEAEAKVRAAAEEMAAQRAAFEAEQEAARQALQAQASQIASERAALEVTKSVEAHDKEVAAYAAAVFVPIQASALVETAQAATETVAEDVIELAPAGESLSMEVEPPRPTDADIVHAVAAAFATTYDTALSWLEELDFHELNR